LFVCLLATLRKNVPTDLREIFSKLGNGSMKKLLNFGGDPDHRMDTGIVFGFVANGRYGKWLTDINLLLMLIRQMVALVRRALADVCTVPVLLVYLFI